MKIALITDTHFGARSDSQQFDSYFKKFYDNTFFPELEKQGITQIIHLGDCFDRRKYINFSSLKSCKEYFFDRIQSMNIKMDMIVGNHDTFYKNTNDVNSPELLLKEYQNIRTFENPTEVTYEDRSIIFLPWLCADNYTQAVDLIKDTKAKVCFGHLEIAGFVMYKGQNNTESHDGMDSNLFKNFDLVCSGHFHHKHGKNNIQYLGNPYQLFWNDYEDSRGFHIFDTDTLELEFVKNPYTIFDKIYYDDEKEQVFDYDTFTSKLLKLIVVNKKDFVKFDKLIENIYLKNPIELRIIEDFSEFESEALDEAMDMEDTMTLLSNYVDSVETDSNKDKIKGLLKSLYVEAQHYDKV
jgi:DNA repair exonuclease SbcCD nuclease subunit